MNLVNSELITREDKVAKNAPNPMVAHHSLKSALVLVHLDHVASGKTKSA